MGFDMREVRDLAEALETSTAEIKPEVQAIVKRGAVNIKRDSQKDIVGQVGRSHAKHYGKAITFDLKDDGMTAEVGPEVGRKQAFLGKILEFGTATSPPHPHMVPALEAEVPRFQKALLKAVSKVLGK